MFFALKDGPNFVQGLTLCSIANFQDNLIRANFAVINKTAFEWGGKHETVAPHQECFIKLYWLCAVFIAMYYRKGIKVCAISGRQNFFTESQARAAVFA